MHRHKGSEHGLGFTPHTGHQSSHPLNHALDRGGIRL
ncbi:MAG: hypothetical protein [Arizlama microvirus]|nr:MAG: hypothetical protein [Arizlama microvirus]